MDKQLAKYFVKEADWSKTYRAVDALILAAILEIYGVIAALISASALKSKNIHFNEQNTIKIHQCALPYIIPCYLGSALYLGG